MSTEAAVLPFLQEAAAAAGYPPDRGTQLWILDAGRRGREAYDPEKLVRRRDSSPSVLEWKTGLRLPNLKELEYLYGFPGDHTGTAIPSGQLKSSGTERVRRGLLEKSGVPRLLWPAVAEALKEFKLASKPISFTTYVAREQSNADMPVPFLGLPATACGVDVETEEESAEKVRKAVAERDGWCDGQRLVAHHIANSSTRGSDVRLDTGALTNPNSVGRHSLNRALWKWKLAFKWQWRLSKASGTDTVPEHINSLELRAAFQATRWHFRGVKSIGLSTMRAVDSRAALGVMSKYRSSSKILQRTVRRLAALEMAAMSRMSTAFVRSDWNESDAGSRAAYIR